MTWFSKKIEYVLINDISKGEELTVNYNGNPDDKTRMWLNSYESDIFYNLFILRDIRKLKNDTKSVIKRHLKKVWMI